LEMNLKLSSWNLHYLTLFVAKEKMSLKQDVLNENNFIVIISLLFYSMLYEI